MRRTSGSAPSCGTSWVWDVNRPGIEVDRFRSGAVQLRSSDSEVGSVLGEGTNAAVHAADWAASSAGPAPTRNPSRHRDYPAWVGAVPVDLSPAKFRIMAGILSLTVKVIREAREGDLESVNNVRLEFLVASTFMSRMEFTEIKSAIDFICRG